MLPCLTDAAGPGVQPMANHQCLSSQEPWTVKSRNKIPKLKQQAQNNRRRIHHNILQLRPMEAKCRIQTQTSDADRVDRVRDLGATFYSSNYS